MTTPPPTNRMSLAITAAVASTTLAIGVTVAALFGWLAPPSTTPALPETPASPVETVPAPAPEVAPIPASEPAPPVLEAPEDVTFAMNREEHEHEHGHHDRHDEDDDDD